MQGWQPSGAIGCLYAFIGLVFVPGGFVLFGVVLLSDGNFWGILLIAGAVLCFILTRREVGRFR